MTDIVFFTRSLAVFLHVHQSCEREGAVYSYHVYLSKSVYDTAQNKQIFVRRHFCLRDLVIFSTRVWRDFKKLYFRPGTTRYSSN